MSGAPTDFVALAAAICEEAHAAQVDKAGAPYAAHPKRVAAGFTDDEARCVAYLHDVVEDCADWPLARLAAAGFPPRVIAAIEALTKRVGEENESYLARVTADPLAVRVKIADMRDNMDLSRIASPTAKDFARLEKYRQMLPRLEAALARTERQS